VISFQPQLPAEPPSQLRLFLLPFADRLKQGKIIVETSKTAVFLSLVSGRLKLGLRKKRRIIHPFQSGRESFLVCGPPKLGHAAVFTAKSKNPVKQGFRVIYPLLQFFVSNKKAPVEVCLPHADGLFSKGAFE
jgi:hypothetical protein